MRTINILVSVSGTVSATSKSSNDYKKLMVSALAARVNDVDSLWTNPPCITVKGKKYPITMLNISDTITNQVYTKWVKGKDVPLNVLVLTCDEHIAGVTEYIKDGEIHKHGASKIEDGSALLGDISYDVQSCIQSGYEIYGALKHGVEFDAPVEVYMNNINRSINISNSNNNRNRHE